MMNSDNGHKVAYTNPLICCITQTALLEHTYDLVCIFSLKYRLKVLVSFKEKASAFYNCVYFLIKDFKPALTIFIIKAPLMLLI